MTASTDTVVIALGNRFRGDDAVGPCVADKLKLLAPRCNIVDDANDALAIVDAWQSARTAIVVDALADMGSPGSVHRFESGVQPLPKTVSRCSSHGLGVAEAMELSRVMGRLPARIIIFAIEAASFEPGAPLSPEVTVAVDAVARQVAEELQTLNGEKDSSRA